MLRTLLRNLKGTDWEMLTDFVSPVFFDVVPTMGMASVFARIAKDYANKSEFSTIKQQTRSTFKTLPDIDLKDHLIILDEPLPNKKNITELSAAEKKHLGELTLKLYFSQIFHCQSTILDLRSSAFGRDNEWSPKSLFYTWDKGFLSGICCLYRGFYDDHPTEFSEGLKRLNLSHAAGIFREHFGEGSQDNVTFSLAHFKKSFHAIFVSCKEHRTKLHPDFFALGVYLVCLYEHLELLGLPLDVRSAFKKVTA